LQLASCYAIDFTIRMALLYVNWGARSPLRAERKESEHQLGGGSTPARGFENGQRARRVAMMLDLVLRGGQVVTPPKRQGTWILASGTAESP
jgi:hypothetical protein